MMTFNLFTDFLIVFAWTKTQSLKLVILAIKAVFSWHLVGQLRLTAWFVYTEQANNARLQ